MSAREPGPPGRHRDDELTERAAWALLLACARQRREGRSSDAFALDRVGGVRETSAEDPESALAWQADNGWRPCRPAAAGAETLLDLYLPLCRRAGAAPLTLAHLGQSLDGYIATHSGDSCFVNDRPDLVHLHRLRALSDAVIVGAGTVAADDPRLTTRHVAGPSPVRVVLDPGGRLDADRNVFRDGAAPTLLVRARTGAARHGLAQTLPAPLGADGRLDRARLLGALRERGLHTLFIEGGGVTVSRFLAADLVDRLQVAVAPFLMGEGRPGLRLPARARLADCPRPAARRFQMGEDVLFDLDLRSPAVVDGSQASAGRLPTITTTP